MAYTQKDIDDLKKAIASGISKVKINGRETEYRSLTEMKNTLAQMEKEVNGTTSAPYKYSSYDRGYQ